MTGLSVLPVRRSDNITVVDLPEETLVYDEGCHKAFCLNRTSALVWRHCDGKTPVAEVAAMVADGEAAHLGEDVVELAVRQLGEMKLLQAGTSLLEEGQGISRRELLRKATVMGIAASLLPVVASLAAPGAVEAASCLPDGADCELDIECCSGDCTGTCQPSPQ